MLEQLEADAEALVVNRISDPPQYAIVPIDQCYALVGLIKSRWEGISGGSAIEQAVPEFFAAAAERGPRAAPSELLPMSVRRPRAEQRPRPLVPEPEFAVTGAAHMAFAATPTMLFAATATDPSGHEIQSIALTAQVMIDPAKRGYDPETRERLAELFGPPASWAPSTSGLAWARVAATVPGFTGSTTFALEVPCTYDLEVAAAKYFYAVAGRRGAAQLPLQRQRLLPRPPAASCRSSRCPGAAPRSSGCRSRRGGR